MIGAQDSMHILGADMLTGTIHEDLQNDLPLRRHLMLTFLQPLPQILHRYFRHDHTPLHSLQTRHADIASESICRFSVFQLIVAKSTKEYKHLFKGHL